MPEVTDGLEDVVDGVLRLPSWDDGAVGAIEHAVGDLQAKLRLQWDELRGQGATVEQHLEGTIRSSWDEDWRALESLRGQLVEMLNGVPGRLAAGNEAREAIKRQRLLLAGAVSQAAPIAGVANSVYNWVVD